MSDQKGESKPSQQAGDQVSSETTKKEERESVTIDVSQNNQQTPPAATGFRATLNRCQEGLLNRPIQYDIISIIYTLLIAGGGIYAYISKDSTPSLVVGVLFGILLAVGTYFEGSRKNPWILLVILVFLTSMFAYRYFVSLKFMPSGLFAILSTIMVIRNCYIIYVRKRQPSTTG